MSAPRLTEAWVTAPGVQAVCAMLTQAGHQAWFVGGCVRNALLGEDASDIDITTDARPDRVVALAKAAGFNPVPTGIDHGTVTVVVRGEPFEVTTFRKDVETDGRRAVVAFADRIEEDAHRRDFTMNALYAAPDGQVADPLGGLADLRARRVRFIDDAGARIREDYLRILRFFRFHAWYGDPEAGLDADGLAAIAENSAGIETLSRERIGAEMRKLLAAPDPAPALAAMAQSGALGRVAPGFDPRAIAPLVHVEGLLGLAPDAMRRLAALGGGDLRDALRLSKADARRLELLRAHVAEMDAPAALGYRLGEAAAMDVIALKAALLEQLPAGDARAEVRRGAAQSFPLSAADLMPGYTGAALGRRLGELEARWIASDFALGREALLKEG